MFNIPNCVSQSFIRQLSNVNIILAGFALSVAVALITLQTKKHKSNGENSDENKNNHEEMCSNKTEKNKKTETRIQEMKFSSKNINVTAVLFLIPVAIMIVNHFIGTTILSINSHIVGCLEELQARKFSTFMYYSTVVGYLIFISGLGSAGWIKSKKLGKITSIISLFSALICILSFVILMKWM